MIYAQYATIIEISAIRYLASSWTTRRKSAVWDSLVQLI